MKGVVRRFGIVLKSKVLSSKISLLDQEEGHIEVYSFQKRLFSVGMLVSYTLSNEQGRYIIKNVSIEQTPEANCDELLFVHHVIELIIYLVPIQSSDFLVFEQCLFLYRYKEIKTICKKILLYNLFVITGMVPESLSKASLIPIDTYSEGSLHLADERNIDESLRGCIRSHPAIDSFKTKQFLVKHVLI